MIRFSMSSFGLGLSILIFQSLAIAQDPAIEHCHKLEGVRLQGCSPQSKPLECGPPKPCPPCNYFESCGTMIVAASGGGGICIAYGEPPCEDTPDGRVCGPAPCIEYTQPRCENENVRCGRSPVSVPSTGTYDCEIIECRCPTPPPNLVDCGASLICQENRPCPTN